MFNPQNPDIVELNRQRKMAELLTSQGFQTPKGETVSGGVYVPSNPFEQLSNLYSVYAGKKKNEELDVKEQALAKALREQTAQDFEGVMQAYQGTPAQAAVPESYKMLEGQFAPRDEEGNLMPGTQYSAGKEAVAAIPGSKQAAMAKALMSQDPEVRAFGAELRKQMFKDPKWEKTERTVNGMKQSGWVDLNSPMPEATFRVGSVSPDLEMAKASWEGYLPNSGGAASGFSGANASPANFNTSVNKVLGFEGGYVAKDGKSGAPANFGINQKANPDIDVKNLTKDQAISVYKTRYWDAINGDQLPAKTAEIAFDAAVNQGPDYAKQLIAKTGGDPVKMLQQRAQDYTNIVKNDPTQAQYLPSWMNRLNVLSQDVQPAQAGQQGQQPPAFQTKAQQDAWLSGQRKTAELKSEAEAALPGALLTAQTGINTINELIGDTTVDKKGNIVYGKQKPKAGFEAAVGMPSFSSGFGIANLFPGSEASDFKAAFEQVSGQAFLGAIGTLKGSGAISEVEGAKATSALNRMKLSQSEAEFIKAANDFKEVLQKGYAAAQQRAGAAPFNPNAQPNTQPSANNAPKLRYNLQTGQWE